LKILLVRLRLIGDVVFTTPLVRRLARHFPSAELVYLVERGASPVVADNPWLSDVIVLPHRRGWRRFADDLAAARALRRRKFDVAVDLHGGPRSAWLTWASGAPVRVGYDVPGRQWMYTRLVHRPRTLGRRHSVENQWDLLAAVDPALAAPADRERDRVEMPSTEPARAAVTGRLAALGVPAGARVILLHVSAGNPFRRWPEPSFAELAARLVVEHRDRWVLVTGGPSDGAAAARVIANARAAAGEAAARIASAEALSLPELRAAMDHAALFIGGDSGPLHIAATTDVPIVGLYGPTPVERSAPWRPETLRTASVDVGALPCRPCEQRTCVPGDFRCLTGISAATVHAAAERLLEAG
jgi:lipopolysaccharide heptosyltransferase II